jgi:hypothetical protein
MVVFLRIPAFRGQSMAEQIIGDKVIIQPSANLRADSSSLATDSFEHDSV